MLCTTVCYQRRKAWVHNVEKWCYQYIQATDNQSCEHVLPELFKPEQLAQNNLVYLSKYDTNSNKMFKGINDMMLNSVQGNVLNNKDFKMSYLENEKFYLVEMTPKAKEMKEYMKSISMYFDKQDYTVSKIRMTELSDDYTAIEFSNKKINEAIADTQFVVK